MVDDVRRLAAPGARRRHGRHQRRRPGRRGGGDGAWPTARSGSSRRPWSTKRAAGADEPARGLADRFATAAGPGASRSLGRIVGERSRRRRRCELHGLRPGEAPLTSPPARRAGRHNAANALGVAGAAAALGVDADARSSTGLGTFAGVGRRLERKGEAAGVVVYDDYGHHPTAIRETLAAVRQREPGRRVWAVYEPLTYHRTAALLAAFADALATADAVAIADIWAGRDPDTTVASAAGLAEAVARLRPDIPVEAPGLRRGDAPTGWRDEVRAGDAVLVMGGGHSYRIGGRPAATTIGGLIVDHASAADLLDRYKRAWETFDGDAWTALFTEDAEYHGTRSSRRWSGTTRSGHTCSKRPSRRTRSS